MQFTSNACPASRQNTQFVWAKTRYETPRRNPGNNGSMPEEGKPSFEASLQELEAIVKEMEGADLPLERALEIFERGMKLSDACRKQLAEAETRVEILTKRAGSMQPEPFPKA